jgi:hypothetical protein
MAVSGTIGRIMQVIASNTRTERGSGQGSEHKRELRRYHGRGRIAVDVAIGIVPRTPRVFHPRSSPITDGCQARQQVVDDVTRYPVYDFSIICFQQATAITR